MRRPVPRSSGQARDDTRFMSGAGILEGYLAACDVWPTPRPGAEPCYGRSRALVARPYCLPTPIPI